MRLLHKGGDMMKSYYVRYYLNFNNTYDLCYTETEEQERKAVAEGYVKISRREAVKLCAEENYRRKHDSAFSGFANNLILPYGYSPENDWRNDRMMYQDGYLVLRR